jgi:parallel beta-helix repeat protein
MNSRAAQQWKILMILLIGYAHAACTGSPPVSHNVRDFGAVGDGMANDTKAIQQAIDQAAAGDTVYIDEGTYNLISLRLKSGVHLVGEGLLVQQLERVQDYSNEKQASPTPLVRGRDVEDIYLSINARAQHEAVYLLNCKNIRIERSVLEGDSAKLRSFAGILIYDSQGIDIAHTKVRYFGRARQHTHSYQPGTGIRILDSKHIAIVHSLVEYNGENGVFMHNSADVSVDTCRLRRNGMSGIQVAFGSGGTEKNFRFSHNTIEHNAADAIDINNRSDRKYHNIHCEISSNTTRNNGFVNGQSTPDGSGIATLINVSGVRAIDNIAMGNNRPAIYLESCGDIELSGNRSDGQVEIVKNLKSLEVRSSTFKHVTLLANVRAQRIRLSHSNFNNIYLPNGISVDSLVVVHSAVAHAAININMQGHVRMSDNELTGSTAQPVVLVVKANSTSLMGNTIKSAQSAAIVVRRSAEKVTIADNTIAAPVACIADDGSKGLTIKDNRLLSLHGGTSRLTIRSKNPNQLVLAQNEHRGEEGQMALLLEGKGTATIRSERILAGLTDYGAVEILNQNR